MPVSRDDVTVVLPTLNEEEAIERVIPYEGQPVGEGKEG